MTPKVSRTNSTATEWEKPPRAKFFEALSAIADRRVRIVDEFKAEVDSSDRSKTYIVGWTSARTRFSSNDNGSYWKGYVGYPIIAVLMLLDVLNYDPNFGKLLAGIPWKTLNDRHHGKYDNAVAEVLSNIAPGESEQLQSYIDRLAEKLESLHLERLGSELVPPTSRKTDI